MSLASLIPKLLEKTKEGKLSWLHLSTESDSEFRWVSSKLPDSNNVFIIDQKIVVLSESPSLEIWYFLRLCDAAEGGTPYPIFSEKVTLQQISGLVKEIRSILLNKDYKSTFEKISTSLNNL